MNDDSDEIDQGFFEPYGPPDSRLVLKRSSIIRTQRDLAFRGEPAPDFGVPPNWPPTGWIRDEFPKDYSVDAALAWIRFEQNLIDVMHLWSPSKQISAEHQHVVREILNDLILLVRHFFQLGFSPAPEPSNRCESAGELCDELWKIESWLTSAPAPNAENDRSAEPKPFSGGQIVFFEDHVELCGVEICRGHRSKNARLVLVALCEMRNDKFMAYSATELAAKIRLKSGVTGIFGKIRDLRKRISEELLSRANIRCGNKAIILSGGPGYRLSENLTVQFAGQQISPHLQGHDARIAVDDVPNNDPEKAGHVPNGPIPDVPNVPNRNVPKVADAAAVGRRIWILQELATGRKLRAPDVKQKFGGSLKTAKRDLQALKKAKKIDFVGPSRTGYYQLINQQGQADA